MYPARPRIARNRNHDTCLLQARLIARGLSTKRMPGGVTMAYVPLSIKTLAFAGTIPQGTTFDGAALSLKHGAAWTLLGEAELPIPRWKVFLTRAVKAISRYAEDLGFPLAVSGLKGEHLLLVQDHNELTSAMHELGEEKNLGKVIVRSHLDGDEVKVLVLGDKAISFSVDSPIRHDHEVERIAIQSKGAIPGLALAEVRMTVGKIVDSRDSRSVVVTGFSPAPRLRDYATSAEEAAALADTLIEAEAKAAGIALDDPLEEVHASLTIVGTVDSSVFTKLMQPFILEAQCREISAPELLTQESVRFDITGPPAGISQLSVHALHGLGEIRSRAHMTTTETQRGTP